MDNFHSSANSAPRDARSLVRSLLLATALAGALVSGGCQRLSDVTGSITRSEPAPTDVEGMRQQVEQLGRTYDRSPNDKAIVMRYARALRATGQLNQANAVLQRAAATSPSDLEILGAYGKSLSDIGRLEEAASVLEKSHTPERPNWSIYSAQGAVADKMGQHQNAQTYYRAALQIAPEEPSVLSNLGLSYALTKQLPLAEETLRRASAHPKSDGRVRQNLALVLALQGKFNEAEDVQRKVLPPAEAAANIAQIRQMIAQSNTWRDIQNMDRNPAPRSQARAPRQPQRTASQQTSGQPAKPPAGLEAIPRLSSIDN